MDQRPPPFEPCGYYDVRSAIRAIQGQGSNANKVDRFLNAMRDLERVFVKGRGPAEFMQHYGLIRFLLQVHNPVV